MYKSICLFSVHPTRSSLCCWARCFLVWVAVVVFFCSCVLAKRFERIRGEGWRKTEVITALCLAKKGR